MDLGQFDVKSGSNKGAFLHLTHPVSGERLVTDDGQDIGLTLLGEHSDLVRKKIHKLVNTRNNGKRRVKAQTSSEQNEQDGIDLLAGATLEVHNIEWNGETVTVDNVDRFYRDCPWAKDQVDEFVGDMSNFLGE